MQGDSVDATTATRDFFRSENGSRVIFFAIGAFLISTPFLMTTFPPITDLPQQAAQIRLFLETLSQGDESPYLIQWFTPYSLSYVILGVCWMLFGALHAGRMAMMLICIGWVGSIHWTAARTDRSAASAVIASGLALNHIVYWGFYSFALGWPAFLVWMAVTQRDERNRFSWKEAGIWFGAALLLYVCHVLWFIAGMIWLGLRTLVISRSLRPALYRFLYLLPVFVVTAIWYSSFATSSMETPATWAIQPLERLRPGWLVSAAIGGLRGPYEFFFLVAAGLWIGVGLIQSRGQLRESVNFEFLLAAGMFLVAALVLPDKYMNTIMLWQRWVPGAIILIILAVPAPKFEPLLKRLVAALILAAFCSIVSVMWMTFESKELSGLARSIASLDRGSRVLGLSMIKDSDYVRGWPFIQTFAYAQVVKGCGLNFSFAEFSPCLVVFKELRPPPWTHGLEWFPRKVRNSDLLHFDYVLINAKEPYHEQAANHPMLQPVTNEGRWRLYRVHYEAVPRRDGTARPEEDRQ